MYLNFRVETVFKVLFHNPFVPCSAVERYGHIMRKIAYVLLFIIVISLSGCNSPDTQQQIDPTNSGNPQNTSVSPSPQCNTSQQSSQALSAEISEKIEAFYKEWTQKQLKLNENDSVNYYALTREGSQTLLIYLDGSGYQSVMGVKSGNDWISAGNAYSLAKKQFPEYDFLTMDKVNITMSSDHSTDSSVISNYTFENRVNGSVAAIDDYLRDRNYEEVIIFGISEGGYILPSVYSKLEQKDKITKLIVLGEGGLSQYEEFKLLKDSDLSMQPGYKEAYTQIEDAYTDICSNPDSIEKQYLGYPYKRWYGFFKYNPMDDYINIDIPILLLHGALDTNSPVEASRAVDEEFEASGKANLKYIEYADMGHNAESKEQNDRIFYDITNWLAAD